MGKRLFGTDGIRGVAGEPPLDPKTVTSLGIALGKDLHRQGVGTDPVLIGMDTRESGPVIAAQLTKGLNQSGVAALFAGVVTTPGVAYLTRTGRFGAGVMISASHNQFQDNGIKVFSRTGYKLPDKEEHEIEEEIFRLLEYLNGGASPASLARTFDVRPYMDFLLSTIQTKLNGLKLVIDCGNGAASDLAPQLFREAGADVTTICCHPDGRNINLGCGALHVEGLRKAVLEHHADAGVAFDGDADRAILISPSGRIVDGDAEMLIAARRLQADGHLAGNVVVSTVMSNLGLEKALGRLGISMVRTPVGDKYVLEEMLRREAALGGEQSGHVIFREYATTGDGMLTALKLLETCVREKATLDELASDLTVFPQLLVNIRVRERKPLDELPGVVNEIRACESALDGSGRVLVRFSGTEPLARVMVEGSDLAEVENWAERIAAAIRTELA
ncbi:MAG TPA: phosphoglucosamine mutase [Bryobacteraceae bacterium]|jgi:phosphoglucosamine mutase|nr:phosphoglucosamine mutase [Bryobacteraceae bacterium]